MSVLGLFFGGLIQAAVGRAGGFGATPLKRMGWAANAASSVMARFLGHRRSGAIVDGGRCHQADSTVAVFVVVPLEEPSAVSASVLDRAEAFGGSRVGTSGF